MAFVIKQNQQTRNKEKYMKKLYVKPEMSLHGIQIGKLCLNITSVDAAENSKGLSKDRGGRSDNTDSFEDLW